TRGGTPFRASWRGSVAADQPISLSYPTGLLPKAVLIFGCRQDQIGRAGSASTSEHQNKEPTARMASYLHCYHWFERRARGAGPTHDQKMYSRVAFGSPLLTSREYSTNLTHPRRSVQGIQENG